MMARLVCSEENKLMYSDENPITPMQTHLANQIQGFVSDPEMFNLTAGMEMIGFHKNLQQQQQQQSDHIHNNVVMWKSFIAKPGNSQGQQHLPSSSSSYQHDEYNNSQNNNNKAPQDHFTSSENLIVGGHDSVSSQWQDIDDSSLRCVFPCEGNERPSQGLSLSLSSNNPSSIGLQPFELRQTTTPHHHHHHHHHEQQEILQQQGLYNGHFVLKNSKYLIPAQELLNEFCSLDTKHGDLLLKQKWSQKNMQWEEDSVGGSSSSSKKHSLTSLEFAELQKRKTKLLSMLEEVDRRYKHYRNQMKGVVSSFEAVAGNGAATVYSALALKAMSRHFRCLKDGILSQIHVTRKSMGEKDPVAPGTTRGETPRLKIIDQTLRQQRAFQQMNMLETHPWRPQRGLPERSVSVLRAWLFEHFLHPYPSDVDKHILARQTGLSRSQVSNWFINARVRLWKPMVEEMYLEETKEGEIDQNNIASSEWSNEPDHHVQIQNPSEDQKPTLNRLVQFESESGTSIISSSSNKNNPKSSNNNNNNKTLHHHMNNNNNNNNPQEQCLGRVTDTSFGSVELDFSSYSQGLNFNGGGGGGGSSSGVSLTLGLQQHGVSLAFPPPNHHHHQGSLLYSRDQIEDCQTVPYSLMDGEGQNLPYRNLMGAQLLRDLAG